MFLAWVKKLRLIAENSYVAVKLACVVLRNNHDVSHAYLIMRLLINEANENI